MTEAMPEKIDRTKVRWMLKTGFHPEAIAQRLGCSRRQVDRIIEKNGWTGPRHIRSFESEKDLWGYYREWGESYSQIARRFGVSREAVRKYFLTTAGIGYNQKAHP